MRGRLESRLLIAVGLVAAGIGAARAEEPDTRGVYIIDSPQSAGDGTVQVPPPASQEPVRAAPPPGASPGSQPSIPPATAAAPPLDTEPPRASASAPLPPPATADAPQPPGFGLSGQSVGVGAQPDASLAPSALKLTVENSAQLSLELVPGPDVTVGTKISFRVRAKKSGYLVLVDIDPNGKLTQLYPNLQALSGPNSRPKSNFIKAGRTVVIPDAVDLRAGTEYVAAPPFGRATIVAVLSDRPVQMLDLTDIPRSITDQAAEVAYLSHMTSELRILGEDGAPQQARWSFDAKSYAIRGSR